MKRLKGRKYYENLYDRLTIERARRNMVYYNDTYDKWFEILPDESVDSMRSTLHLNMIYMSLVGQELVECYEQRNERIKKMMSEDEAKDAKVSDARPRKSRYVAPATKPGSGL